MISGSRLVWTLALSLGAVLAVSYAVTAGGAPFMSTLDSVGGVHAEAEYIEGSSVSIVPEFDAPKDCDEAILLDFDGATASGVTLYAELPEPVNGGTTEVGYELAEEDYYFGSLQVVVSEMDAEFEVFDTDLGNDVDGFVVDGGEFRFVDVTTRIYGFGSGWFNAPFERTGYRPDGAEVERYEC